MGKRKITCNNSSCKHHTNGGCDTCITLDGSGKCKSFEKGFAYYFHIVCGRLIPQALTMCEQCEARQQSRHVTYNNTRRDPRAAEFYGDAGEQVVEISFITEGDVYRLIVHSKLPSAERFEHWVFDEVLPSIRKHGVYMSDSILDQVIQHPEVIYTLAQELVAEREQLEGIRKQLDAAQPKADYFDTFVNSEDCTCIRNFCKEIGIPEKTAVALLLDHRYLYRSPSGWLMPFADKSARGYFIVRDCYGRSGKLVQQTRVTCKGKNHLFKLFKKWGVIE